MNEVTFSGNTIGDKALYLTGVERGKKDEQERIIKLLEIEATNESSYCTLPIDAEHCSMCWHYDRLIALIKGENK